MELTFAASAPGRCGILGNPSDIYGGRVLSCSIPARAFCRIVYDGRGRRPDDPTLWLAATARYPLDGDFSVEWSSEVPRSSGLAGSTALLAATLASLLAARGEPPPLGSVEDRIAFAEIVRDVERREAGVMCGYQDALMACVGGLQLMNFAGKRPDIDGGPLPSVDILFGDISRFVLVTTGVQRLSGSVHGPMAERWLAGDSDVTDAMEWLAAAAPVGADALIRADWERLADLMNENQRRIAALGGSGDAIDVLIDACRSEGAMAAKLAGAGMGGTVIALVDGRDEFEDCIRARGYVQLLRPEAADGVCHEP